MYIIRIGEIFLKGKNRKLFDRYLERNLKTAIKKAKLINVSNKYLLYSNENLPLNKIFGLTSYSKCQEVEFKDIEKTALSLINNEKTFRITANRTTKEYKPSPKIQIDLGEYIFNNTNLKVDLHNPEINIHIDIINGKAYLFTEKIKCPGGLPVGCEGQVYLKVSNEKKAIVATYLLLKRGTYVILSKELPELHKYEYGFKLRIKEHNNEILATDETLEDVKFENKKELILRPLITYSEDDIEKLYKEIT